MAQWEPWLPQLRTPILLYLLPSSATFASSPPEDTSNHLSLGLPTLPPPEFTLSYFPTVVLLIICPIHSSLLFLIYATIYKSLYISSNSRFVLTIHIPFFYHRSVNAVTIFLSHVFSRTFYLQRKNDFYDLNESFQSSERPPVF
jgi:hypothetical protein